MKTQKLKRYRVHGDILRPGVVIIEARNKREAEKRAAEGEFDEVYDEDTNNYVAGFKWCGDDAEEE